MSAANGSSRTCAGCGLPLSMYNSEPLCQACVSKGRAEWQSPPEKITVDGAKIAELRLERGWTQAIFADRIGFTVDLVKKLEQPRRGGSVRLSTLHAVAHVLQVPLTDLLKSPSQAAPAVREPAENQPSAAAEPAGISNVYELPTRFSAELARFMEMRGVTGRGLARRAHFTPSYISIMRSGRRRPSLKSARIIDEALAAGGQLVAAAVIEFEEEARAKSLQQQILRPLSLMPTTANPETLTAQLSGVISFLETTNVGDATLGYLDSATIRLANECLNNPPVQSHERAGALAKRVFDMLRSGHQHINQVRDLYVIGGKLCAVLSWASSDLGQLTAAETYVRYGWTLADQADHSGLRALLLCARSKNAFLEKRYDDAATYARRGYECQPPGTARILLACQEADALQIIGKVDDAKAALDRAEQARDGIRQRDELGGVFACGPARQANYSIATYLRAGAIEQALQQVERAEMAWRSGDSWAYGTWAQVQIGAAIAHLLTGQVEGAAEILPKLFDQPTDLHLATLAMRLQREVVPLLTDPVIAKSQTAAMLLDRIAEYSRDEPVKGKS